MAVVIIQENGEYSFCVTALRIEVPNACSQYSKYQSVSIITISSRRDPNASPAHQRSFLQTTSKAFCHCSFHNPLLSSADAQKEQKPNQGQSTKAGRAVKPTDADLPQIHLTLGDLICHGLQGSSDLGFVECFFYFFFLTSCKSGYSSVSAKWPC